MATTASATARLVPVPFFLYFNGINAGKVGAFHFFQGQLLQLQLNVGNGVVVVDGKRRGVFLQRIVGVGTVQSGLVGQPIDLHHPVIVGVVVLVKRDQIAGV